MVVMVVMGAVWLLGLTQRLPVCLYLSKGSFIRLQMVEVARVNDSMARKEKTWSW